MTRSYLGQVLVVGLGGFVGSAARFAVTGFVHRFVPMTFPYGTLAVNVLGCLAIGLLGGLLEVRHTVGPAQRLFLMVGVLGGFTTFSALAYQTLGFAQTSELWKALGNVILHVTLGMAAAWLGYLAAQSL